MRTKKQKLVQVQYLSEQRGSKNSYERYVANSKEGEDMLANPDCLVERNTSPSTPQLLMGEAILHLQGRQREVYLLVMREDKSMAEAAEILNISKGTVQTYLDRAIAFIVGYCHEAMQKGRV